MFKKVLIAEDHQIANFSVQKTLEELQISEVEYVYYCDHAFSWVQNAHRNGQPYDLLITDLIFDEDQTPQSLKGGLDLIQSLSTSQIPLKIIVLSAECRPSVIHELFQKRMIQGYIRKARHDAQYLKEALQIIANGGKYQSPEVREALLGYNAYELSTVDIAIVDFLSQGASQKDIPSLLKAKGVSTIGLRTVEKNLHQMRFKLGFSKNEQLVLYCKERNLI